MKICWMNQKEYSSVTYNCEKIFETKIELDNHLQQTHSTTNVSSKIGRTRNVCFNCNLKCKSNQQFRTHIEKTHKVEDGYKCDKCDKVFRADNLMNKALWSSWLKHTKQCSKNIEYHERKYQKLTIPLTIPLVRIDENKAMNHDLSEDTNENEDQDEITEQAFDLYSDDDNEAGIFICDNCDKIFGTKVELDLHLQEVHNLQVDKSEPNKVKKIRNFCYNCEKLFDRMDNFRSHIETVHKVANGFKCDKCDIIRSQRGSWLQHSKQCSGNTESTSEPKRRQRNICHSCEIIFTSMETYDTHVDNEHKVDSGFRCGKCDKVSVSKRAWLDHVKKCGKMSRARSFWLKYTKQCSENIDGPMKCDKCDSFFYNKSELNYHVKLNHKVRTRNICYNCDKLLEGKDKFRTHIETVHKVTNGYKCDKCGKISKTKEKWLQHTKACTPNSAKKLKCATGNELNCDICNKKFESKFQLYYHKIKFHEDPETCEICGKVSNRHDMTMHRRKAHHMYDIPEQKKVKQCDSCDTEFKSGEEMDNHLRERHNCDMKYECKDCDKKCVSH